MSFKSAPRPSDRSSCIISIVVVRETHPPMVGQFGEFMDRIEAAAREAGSNPGVAAHVFWDGLPPGSEQYDTIGYIGENGVRREVI